MKKMALPYDLFNLKFAEYIDDLRVLYPHDEHFKTICDQYCHNKNKAEIAVQKLRKNMADKLAYSDLSKELEEEILIRRS
ncbi:hypothetical protein ASE40_20685 [Flavobacterium sp. Root935]|uniref:hypothetical protein n=1 Tax=Flavobacterium sp. Root935 TaxID=1736610 RepID=UPI00070D4738|nr:hypothetical protein [Flavobacterium sp. Root935]KRD58731.1 hypothetical protein ASE40_20685 [Flavobacterium sp. Root935]